MADQSSARARYEAWHDRLDVDREADAPWHQLVLRHLNPERDLRGKRVMEVACGRGGFAVRLMRLSTPPPRLIAADFSFSAVSKGQSFAREAGVSAIGWEVADVHSLGHRDASFDTVISCETVEHLPNPREALKEISRVLKTGGRLLLTTPNYLGPMGLYRGYARIMGRPYTEEGQPINNLMMLPRTVHWLRATGFRILAVDAVGHYLLLRGRPPQAIPVLEQFRPLRWLALHSLVVAEKRAAFEQVLTGRTPA